MIKKDLLTGEEFETSRINQNLSILKTGLSIIITKRKNFDRKPPI